MKKIFYLVFSGMFLLITSGAFAQKAVSYGKKISEENSITTQELLERMKDSDSLHVKVKGLVQESCKVKGCWMDMKLSDDKVMKVKFKDYAFFVPKETSNQVAVIEGIARKEVVPVSMLKHYAEDAGKSKKEIAAIKEPQMKITFEAEGVILQF